MLKRNWALIAFVYLVLAEVLSLAPVPDLSLCLIQPEHSQQATDHDDKKYCPAFHTGVALVLGKVDFFLEHHDKSVVGGFTIVLAISTIGLWLATNKLWAAGEKQFGLLAETAAAQSRDMQKSIAVAEKAADAAMLNAKAAIGIELPSLRLEPTKFGSGATRNEDNILHHYLMVAGITVSNTGRTKAIPIELNCGWTFGIELPPEPSYMWDTAFKVDVVIDPSPADPIEFWLTELQMDAPADAYDQLRNRTANFWFYVRLVYLDFMGARHETSFCWRRFEGFGTGQFFADDTPSYNRKT